MEVGSIIRDVFTADKSEAICDRIYSLWSKRFDVWRGLPTSVVLGETAQAPNGLKNLTIGYTVCTKDNKPLMLVDIFSSVAPSTEVLEVYSIARQSGVQVSYLILSQDSHLKEEYHINVVDSIITSTIGAEYVAEEYAEYEQMQQPFLDHVAVELPGEGSSPAILDWYAGDEVDAATKYDPLSDRFQRLRTQFAGMDRHSCPWGTGVLSCTVKANISPIDIGSKDGMVGRSMTIATHLGDVASGPLWVSEFNKADIVASGLAGILALSRAITLIKG